MVHFFEGVGFGVSHKLAPGIFYFVLVVFYITTLILPRSLILPVLKFSINRPSIPNILITPMFTHNVILQLFFIILL